MAKTHLIIDEGTPNAVGFPVEVVVVEAESDLTKFKQVYNSTFSHLGWNEAKQEEVFNAVLAEVNATPTPAPTEPSAPKAKQK